MCKVDGEVVGSEGIARHSLLRGRCLQLMSHIITWLTHTLWVSSLSCGEVKDRIRR